MKSHYEHGNISILTFNLGKETLAINIEKVIEVIRDVDITDVPKTSEYISGIINFRGEIVTIVDTKKKINLSKLENLYDRQVIMVIELEYEKGLVRIGALVDKVRKVLEIAENEIQEVPEFGNYYNPEYLKGAIKIDEEYIMLIDAEKIFSSDEVKIIQNAAERQ